MKKILFLLILLSIVPAADLNAQEDQPETAFASVIDVPAVDVVVPGVVELPLVNQVQPQETFLVYEVETNSYLGSYLQNNIIADEYFTTVQTIPSFPRASNLVDNRVNTYVDFSIGQEGINTVTLEFVMSRPIETSRLQLQLAQFVALPQTIELKAGLASELATVIAKRPINTTTVTFPQVTADTFELTLTYSQPLRVSEVRFFETSVSDEVQQSLLFLAQPNSTYYVYIGSDRPVRVTRAESGDLRNAQDIVLLPVYTQRPNYLYVPSDVDQDGVIDILDNCVQVPNADQVDINNNGRGDACDDFDGDGIINAYDNCITIPNRSQRDEDFDGIGDACDDEESRFTEQNQWIPWVGMGMAIIVMLILFTLVARGPKRKLE